MGASPIRNNLRRLRFEAGEMTQQALATAAGVTRQTIVALEAGKYSPSLELAFRLAAAFRKPLEEVFWYEPPRLEPARPVSTAYPASPRPSH